MTKRKYHSEYIKFGFTAINHRGESLPQCVICMKTLSNSAMKPSLLKRHLLSNHSEKKDKGQNYFERCKENINEQRLDKSGTYHQKSKSILIASYEVSFLIAQNMKGHTSSS